MIEFIAWPLPAAMLGLARESIGQKGRRLSLVSAAHAVRRIVGRSGRTPALPYPPDDVISLACPYGPVQPACRTSANRMWCRRCPHRRNRHRAHHAGGGECDKLLLPVEMLHLADYFSCGFINGNIITSRML